MVSILVFYSCDLEGGSKNENNITKKNAIHIAEAQWIKTYGYSKRDLKQFQPYKIELKANVWIVEGSFLVDEDYIHGGTPYIEIRVTDGEVLKIEHGE
ncbi:MAG: hypothetical protein JXR81_06430 [Candidatus Goldbacteria bacterium]|nr:hypothetical protein [Candidatus Goldiibacteriota bacterium]